MTEKPAIENHKAIDLPSRGEAKIRCFTGEALLPDEDSKRQLEDYAAKPGVKDYVTVLPDVHYKSRNPAPSGTVAITEGYIYPRAVDDGINCGMRSMATSLMAKDLTPEILDEIFGRLVKSVPLKKHEEPLISEEDCEEMLVHGLEKLVEPLGLPPDELKRTENHGKVDLGLDAKTVRASLPRKPIGKYRSSVGSLGAGNHFLEMQEIVEICDPVAAERLGLQLGQAMFMMHSDSRKLGKRILAPVHEEAEEAYRPQGTNELFGIPVDTDIGQRYLGALTAATNAGFANRAAITHIVRQTMQDVLGDPNLEIRLVGDSAHETILPEEHNGRTVWVHRHGANLVLPPSDEVRDPELADLGEPVPLAGCPGMDSYLCLPLPGVGQTFNSSPHGAGRVMSKAEAAETFVPEEVEEDIRGRGVRLYRYHTDNIAGQSPVSFKDVASVMDTMVDLDVLRPVVRLRPIAVLKG